MRSFLEKSIVFGYKELQRIHRDPERSVFSVKRIRAHDGCLGTIRRRRTQQTAKNHGEPQPALIRGYPNGATRRKHFRHPDLNQIGSGSHTRGSETSQYPEEKTSIEIP